jgi:hypothetical protein
MAARGICRHRLASAQVSALAPSAGIIAAVSCQYRKSRALFNHHDIKRGRHLSGLKASRNVWLLRDTIDGIAAKCCVFVADLSVCNLRWIGPPSLDFF